MLTSLDKLTRTIRKGWGRLIDPEQAWLLRDLRNDYRATARELGSFIAGGAECEDGLGTFAVLAMTDQPMKAKFYALLTKAMQLAGYSPLVLHQPGQKTAGRYFDLFGLPIVPFGLPTLGGTEHARSLCAGRLTLTSLKGCRYKGVPVGLYALSSTCRVFKQFPTDLNEPEFAALLRKNLTSAAASVDASERFLDENRVRKLLLRDVGYIPAGPLMDVAMARGVDCLVVADSQRAGSWLFKRYTPENYREHEFSIARSSWDALRDGPFTAAMDRAVDEELLGRYTDDARFDKRRLQSGKCELPPEEVRARLGLDPSKKTAVIFAHVSWDGAFFFGEDLFGNFDEWLLEATRAACANPALNWVVKLHPLNVLIHSFDGVGRFEESELAYLRTLEPLPPHVKILRADAEINTRSLFPLIDYALTVRGTVGLELPCLGITALTAGTGRYEGRGFTVDSSTREEYLGRLARLHELGPLPPETTRLARLHYYHLMCRRQVSFEDVAPMEVRQRNEADHRLFNNLQIRARSLDEIRQAKSIRTFVAWAIEGREADLFTPE